MKTKIYIFYAILGLIYCQVSKANFISANSANYTSFLSGLLPGDTLYLTAGSYYDFLPLSNLSGNALEPIVITGAGNSTVFFGDLMQNNNTVNITNCSYMVIKNFMINGQDVNWIDGVKAGGGGNCYAHHITIENLCIVHNGGNTVGDNQTVGISTKCAAWNWIIRRNTIIAAGTGLYLGNSDGTCPFVGGIIENNLIINPKGYCMQIKKQLDTVRDNFAETSNDYQKTIIRYNVFSKDSGATPEGVGDGSRPCLLLDNFPSAGYGTNDMYEVYGNFFYNNPTEALMQITGNTTAYANIFVNHEAPAGYYTILINNHNAFPPRDIKLFHNTILSYSPTGGILLSNPNTGYEQYCYANAVFCEINQIGGFEPANSVDNITDTYNNVVSYVNAPSSSLSILDLYPKVGQLQGTITSSTLFSGNTDYDLDFNTDAYDWIYRGAYAGSGTNPGWHLQMDTMPMHHSSTTDIGENIPVNDFLGMVYPNPANNTFYLELNLENEVDAEITLKNLEGQLIKVIYNGKLQLGTNRIVVDAGTSQGFYLLIVEIPGKILSRKVLINR